MQMDTRVVFGLVLLRFLVCIVINKLKHLLYIYCTLYIILYKKKHIYADKSIRIFLSVQSEALLLYSVIRFLAIVYNQKLLN